MKKLIGKFLDRFEEALRKVCGRITPDKRVTVIVIVFVLFAAVNLWVMFRAIYNIGREINEQLMIDPIEAPDFSLDGEQPSELTRGMEEYFKRNFNIQDNDTTTIEQGQTEP